MKLALFIPLDGEARGGVQLGLLRGPPLAAGAGRDGRRPAQRARPLQAPRQVPPELHALHAVQPHVEAGVRVELLHGADEVLLFADGARARHHHRHVRRHRARQVLPAEGPGQHPVRGVREQHYPQDAGVRGGAQLRQRRPLRAHRVADEAAGLGADAHHVAPRAPQVLVGHHRHRAEEGLRRGLRPLAQGLRQRDQVGVLGLLGAQQLRVVRLLFRGGRRRRALGALLLGALPRGGGSGRHLWQQVSLFCCFLCSKHIYDRSLR
mmetsp:Transcript_41263/g.68138  ORF Transcript_41263/g.68138 Transcript_41263/m.68138 type:complete len:265 (-) Transcript_41263:444-1238(-)